MSDAAIVIETARRWIGTPFLAGASVQSVGCDCAGLMEGIARDLGVACPTRQAVENNILAAATSFLLPRDNPAPGTLILLSRQPGDAPLHSALITQTGTLIHAHWRAGVVENRFGGWFERRVTHIFAWPNFDLQEDN